MKPFLLSLDNVFCIYPNLARIAHTKMYALSTICYHHNEGRDALNRLLIFLCHKLLNFVLEGRWADSKIGMRARPLGFDDEQIINGSKII